jgi:hypothetical protein
MLISTLNRQKNRDNEYSPNYDSQLFRIVEIVSAIGLDLLIIVIGCLLISNAIIATKYFWHGYQHLSYTKLSDYLYPHPKVCDADVDICYKYHQGLVTNPKVLNYIIIFTGLVNIIFSIRYLRKIKR